MYNSLYCKCGQRFNRCALWINKDTCVCVKCNEDITNLIQQKKPSRCICGKIECKCNNSICKIEIKSIKGRLNHKLFGNKKLSTE